MSKDEMSGFEKAYTESIQNPEKFWLSAAQEIDWFKSPTRALSVEVTPHGQWFVDGELNTCHNALDRHIDAGRGENTALIYDSPVTSNIKKFSFAELRHEVALCAGALNQLGVVKGDRVIIYMPMIPETVIAMLACARIGAIHGVVFGGFASAELAVRIDDARPKVIISASCGIEVNRAIPYMPLLNDAINIAEHKPVNVIVVQRPELQS